MDFRLSNVLHLHAKAKALHIAQATAALLRPGGLLVIKEVLLNALHLGPATGAYFSLSLVAYTESGRGYAVAELRALLQSALGCPIDGISILREPAGLSDQVVLCARKADHG